MKRYHPKGIGASWPLLGAVGLGAVATLALLSAVAQAGGVQATVGSLVFALSKNMQLATEVVTHIIAFLIFIWILKKLAWTPLLKVIDDRRAKIEGDFKKAEALQAEAEKTREKYEDQLKAIEDKARAEMQKAIEEGKRIATEIQQKAREDAEALLERAKQNTAIELANARKALRKDVVELTLAATEKVLREQVDQAAHQRHIDKYIDELGGLK